MSSAFRKGGFLELAKSVSKKFAAKKAAAQDTPKEPEKKVEDTSYTTSSKKVEDTSDTSDTESPATGSNHGDTSSAGNNLYEYARGRKKRGVSDLRITGINNGRR